MSMHHPKAKQTPGKVAQQIVADNLTLNEYGEQIGSLNANDVQSLIEVIAQAIEKGQA